MDLQRVFETTVERIPRKLGLAHGSERRSYEQYAGDVHAVGNALRELGMAKGDRVVVIMGNTLEHAIVTTAIVVAGGVSVPFNVRATPLTMAQVVRDADARILVFDDPTYRDKLVDAGVDPAITWVIGDRQAPFVPDGALRLSDLLASGSRERPPVDVGEGDLANILYTSGTTGMPKGIPHEHGHIYERMLGWLLHFGPVASGGVRTMGITPLYHITGYHCVFWYTILLNGEYHLPEDRAPKAMLAQIERDRLTYVAAPPIILERLVDAAAEGSYDLDCVNTVVPGSAPRPPHLMDGLRRTFPYAIFGEAYGTSEGVMFGAVDLFEKPGAFQVIGDMVARVVKPGGMPDDVVDDDVEGELIVRMDSKRIVPEYWKRPDETELRFRHGWAYTGDAAHRDPEGDIWIHGRLDDLFISGAENIQPTEVESVLVKHPGVADCTVIGTPEPEWGEWCTAFVVRADPALTVEDLDRFCKDSPELADFKRPRRYVFVDDIERNPTGKVPRKEYRQRWLDGAYETVELRH